ncbi:MAG: hypothetical protein MRY64_07690 [Hyphomonadaceae bacterium]|nr:hypothetical protein [Hyphomonadaceae bacterium]
MPHYASDAEIARLAEGFLDHSLPKESWTHAAHFATALWLLSTRGAATYTEMPGMIRSYNEAKGGQNTDTEGYHETITQASLRAADAALKTAAQGTPLVVTLETLLTGPCGAPGWLLDYWSKDCLFSPEARRDWVAPDLAPLPF